jgi:hypothetical protein
MNWWFAAAVVIVAVTAGILVASPSWLTTTCNNIAHDCGAVSPFLVGFLGAIATAVCLAAGVMRGAR